MPNAASLDALPYRHVLPHTSALSPAGRLSIGGCDLRELAEAYGSPLYVFDEADFRETAREFRREFESRWPEVSVLYAAKAYLSQPLANIVAEEGLGMDVVSGGELAIARAAGFPSSHLYFHGNNKSAEELEAAVSGDPVGRVVVDNFHELAELDRIAGERGARQPILLRVSPNVDPHTHAKTTTGVLDSKFGFAIANGDAERAVAAATAAPNIDPRGLHVHLGSPIFEVEPYEQASDVMCAFAAQMGDRHGFSFDEYSPGGGFALAYTRAQHAPAIAEYAERVARSMEAALAEHRLEQPSLHIEPGRSLIGRAMVAVYTVGARKEIPGVRTYVSVDGGMADNIRPAMYGSGYEAVPVDRPLEEPSETVTVAGKYCESGDILVRDAELPRLEAGELIALPASGGYNLAMSSNYNMALRPPVVRRPRRRGAPPPAPRNGRGPGRAGRLVGLLADCFTLGVGPIPRTLDLLGHVAQLAVVAAPGDQDQVQHLRGARTSPPESYPIVRVSVLKTGNAGAAPVRSRQPIAIPLSGP